jgi:hypothetical protein
MEAFKLLSKYCPVKNNWILLLNYSQVINHQGKTVSRFGSSGQLEEGELSDPTDLVHVFFNYMTDKHLLALVQTRAGQMLLINNEMEIEQPTEEVKGNGPEEEGEVIKLNAKTPLPVIKGISSKLTIIERPDQLMDRELMSANLQKTIGLKEWCRHASRLKEPSTVKLDYSSFFGHTRLKTLLPLVYEWIKQSGETLDFTGQYYLTEQQLSKLPEMGFVKNVCFDQNCQIKDFDWLRRFPQLTHLMLDQCQQIDEPVFAGICRACPKLESVTIKFCCRINIRILLELLKLDRLTKVVVDFPNFYCQVSASEVLVTKEEWKSANSYSLQTLFLNSENLTLDVLDYLLKSCPGLKDIYLHENILKMASKNIMFDEQEVAPEKVVNFHSSDEFRKGFRASRPLTFKNMFKNYFTAPYSKSMLERMRQNEQHNQEIQEALSELKVDT